MGLKDGMEGAITARAAGVLLTRARRESETCLLYKTVQISCLASWVPRAHHCWNEREKDVADKEEEKKGEGIGIGSR